MGLLVGYGLAYKVVVGIRYGFHDEGIALACKIQRRFELAEPASVIEVIVYLIWLVVAYIPRTLFFRASEYLGDLEQHLLLHVVIVHIGLHVVDTPYAERLLMGISFLYVLSPRTDAI